MTSLDLAKNQVCADSLFRFPKIIMLKLKFVVSPQPADSDLCVLTSHLPIFAVSATVWSMYRELATGLAGVWVKCMECCGRLWASWEDLHVRCSQWLVGRLVDGVYGH